MRPVLVILLPTLLLAADSPQLRIQQLTRTPGFVALWDFVTRHPTTRNFTAITAPGEPHDFSLVPINYIREFWNAGRPATLDDFPLLNSGPFGQAILIRPETDPDFRPVLLVPRANLHNSGLDVKGPGQSVTLIAWVIRHSGNHAIAGIWHEGTDLQHHSSSATRVEPGMRQYALFAGLAANNGASAAHVSENGRNSFGDRYARNLSVTPDPIPPESWSVVALVYDNRRRTVTSYLNGNAADYWIENPEKHPFFQWPAKAWGRDYLPPESKPRKRTLLSQDAATRTELHQYEFTRIRVTLDRRTRKVTHRQLIALRVNPFFFNHDLYSPPSIDRGGPFTVGRVIHSGRSVGFTGYIGGVAVFNRALSRADMRRISRIAPNPLPHP
ncbi:MAG: hypothetical protein JNK87_14410 [Bryobacterales bacterium]|nr:hypothetical protein [Bryobacterales bacterium]